MRPNPTSSPNPELRAEDIAIHLLKAMTTLQRQGRRAGLDELAALVAVRRSDVRAVLSRLHQQGYVDVLRMRVTLAGFAVGEALGDLPLPCPRARRRESKRAA